MAELVPVLGLTTLGSLAGLLGGLIVLSKESWSRHLTVHAVPFAAGVLLSVSLLDVLPEAIEAIGVETALGIVLFVMIVAFFFEQFFVHFHHHEEQERTLKSSLPLVVGGDTIHNLIDGAVIASSYLVEPRLGLLVALAAFLHETPHEVADFGLMLKAGWSKGRAILVNVLSASAAYLGAILVLFISLVGDVNLGIILSVAGGLFLYIGASDLLPEVHEEKKDSPWHQAAFLLLGVLLVFLLGGFLPG